MNLREKIEKKLKAIVEPELGLDVLALNLVYNIDVDARSKKVTAKFKPKSIDCSVGIQLALIIKMALMEIEDLKEIDLEVTDYKKSKQANKYLKSLDIGLIKRY